jgi:hypothetical protein
LSWENWRTPRTRDEAHFERVQAIEFRPRIRPFLVWLRMCLIYGARRVFAVTPPFRDGLGFGPGLTGLQDVENCSTIEEFVECMELQDEQGLQVWD